MLIYFLQDFYDEIADQIFKLREQREKCTVNTAARDAQIARINELQDFHQTAPCSLRGLRRGPGETMACTDHCLGGPLHCGTQVRVEHGY